MESTSRKIWEVNINSIIFSDDNSWEQSNNLDEALPSWDNESVASEQYNDGCAHSSVEDLDTLVSQPRQVGFSSLFGELIIPSLFSFR